MALKGIDAQINAKINSWLTHEYDDFTREIIRDKILNNQVEDLIDAFYTDLKFGTGGLRGIMGVGSNRINKYTIGKATQGLCNFLLKKYSDEDISVAVSYDSRINSEYFAQITANIFSANGIKVFFFKNMRPTPQLSFAIRYFNCKSGVMITASHNPREYNGYKAYNSNGGQVISPEDQQIINEVLSIDSVKNIKFKPNQALIKNIEEDFDDIYFNKVIDQCRHKDIIEKYNDIPIVYSSIHGTGGLVIPRVLRNVGFKNIIEVEEQKDPNGNFPTVIFPNPEEEEAMSMAVEYGKNNNAALIMATDPDTDRVGIAVKNNDGEYVLLNGNQIAVLIFNYVIENHLALKSNEPAYIIKTIVTSYILDKIAKKNGITCYNTLTGFKHMGELITKIGSASKFLVGGEESYGYLIGDHCRDKDAVVSCSILAEMAAFYKDKNVSLYQALISTYKKYGLYEEKLISFRKKGKKGAEEIVAMMDKLRNNPPKMLNGSEVIVFKDYDRRIELNMTTSKSTEIDLPKSNVLQFITADGSVISVRPSGTEPKIKFYFSVHTPLGSHEEFEITRLSLQNKINKIYIDLQK